MYFKSLIKLNTFHTFYRIASEYIRTEDIDWTKLVSCVLGEDVVEGGTSESGVLVYANPDVSFNGYKLNLMYGSFPVAVVPGGINYNSPVVIITTLQENSEKPNAFESVEALAILSKAYPKSIRRYLHQCESTTKSAFVSEN